jgi:phenylacetic acid degradation operon negative regulatory protein
MASPAPHGSDSGPVLSRRHAAGAESARGLLFTVLGEFVLPTGGSAWTSAFIEVFSRLGVEEKAIRQALARTAADGWIEPERSGRRTRWRLTPEGNRLLTDGTERIFAFASSQRSWDGSWLLVLARVPERDRSARHVLRTRLGWAGLGSPAPGVWVTTHTERRAEVEGVLQQAGVADAQIFVAEHRGGKLPDLVGQSWDRAGVRGVPRRVRVRGHVRSAGPADRTGARLAALPVRRSGPARSVAAGPVERCPGGPALRRPARQMVTRGGHAVDTAQQISELEIRCDLYPGN